MKCINTLFSTVKSESKIIYYSSIFSLVLGAVCLVGMIFDTRTLMGVSVWLKPLKFSISVAIFIFTVGFLVSIYPYSPRKRKVVCRLVAISNIIDLIIIFVQGSRGVQSHYNLSSAIDGMLYGIMGIFTSLNVLLIILLIVDTIRLKLKTTRSIQWSILMGWLVVFFGSWIGGVMISQLSHNVGIADGGEGLPLVNWSTVAGDLRIAHFFGLHGIQLIPLCALFLNNKWKTTQRNQILVVSLIGIIYAAWIGFLFYQAKQGMPFVKI